MKRILGILTLGCFLCTNTFACTTFVMTGGGKVYFGRNLDWDWQSGLILINQRNVKKTALVIPGHPSAQWVSKYGSVTFNQFGREMPFGGMNEEGLVVENMWLTSTVYPPVDERPEINMLQWIQYQLDNCRTVAEVISNSSKIRLEQPTFPARIHYLVTDARGDSAAIEFLNGKLVVHTGKDLPLRALANTTYESSLAFAKTNTLPAGKDNILTNKSSMSRFAFAAGRAAGFKASNTRGDLDYAFDTLHQVCQDDYTVWRIVYDVTGRQLHFRTGNNPQVRVLDMKTIDFSCGKPVQFADIHARPGANGKIEFQELTEELHKKYLEAFVAQPALKMMLGDISPKVAGLMFLLRSYTCQP